MTGILAGRFLAAARKAALGVVAGVLRGEVAVGVVYMLEYPLVYMLE